MQQMERADYNDQGVSIWMQQKWRFTTSVQNALGHFCTFSSNPVLWIFIMGNKFKLIVQPSSNLFLTE